MVDLEINKGINDQYLWVLHGSVVELHVGGADQQELEQQGLSTPWGRDRGFIMLAFERLCCLWNVRWTGNPRVSTRAASWVSASSSWRSQEAPSVGAVTSSTLLTWLRGWEGDEGVRVTCGRTGGKGFIRLENNQRHLSR